MHLKCDQYGQLYRKKQALVVYLRSADKVGRPFCFCSVSYYFFYYSFLFFFTATCVSNDSNSNDPVTFWVILCFIIGQTLYTVRRDKNFT